MMIATGFVLTLFAWSLLCLGLPRHSDALLRRALPARASRAMRCVGWLLLPVALAVCVLAKGGSQGPVFWAAALMLSALAWVLLLTALTPRRG